MYYLIHYLGMSESKHVVSVCPSLSERLKLRVQSFQGLSISLRSLSGWKAFGKKNADFSGQAFVQALRYTDIDAIEKIDISCRMSLLNWRH